MRKRKESYYLLKIQEYGGRIFEHVSKNLSSDLLVIFRTGGKVLSKKRLRPPSK